MLSDGTIVGALNEVMDCAGTLVGGFSSAELEWCDPELRCERDETTEPAGAAREDGVCEGAALLVAVTDIVEEN